MPGCAAIGWSNSSIKGFIMKKFPKDRVRRKEWAIKMKRDKWSPTDYSCLCEVHFAPEMWEKTRVDGSRKLKINAVPTIFTFSLPMKTRKERKTRQNPTLQRGETELVMEPQPSTSSTTSHGEIQASSTISGGELSEVEGHDISSTESSSPLDDNIAAYEKLEKYGRMYFKQRAKTSKLKCQLRKTLMKLKRKNEMEEKIGPTALLKQVFNDDQVTILKRRIDKKSSKFLKWSNETVSQALKLKFSCGWSGYEELLKQFLINKLNEIQCNFLPDCHNLK